MLAVLDQPEHWSDLGSDRIAPLAPEAFDRDEAQRHLVWLGTDGHLQARCSLWFENTPPLSGRRVGAIGHYAADGFDSGGRLLEHACRELKRTGCDLAVGPMDGNTWRSYRFRLSDTTVRLSDTTVRLSDTTVRLSDTTVRLSDTTEPPFLLEPDHPRTWPAHFRRSGFHVLAHYRSSICTDLQQRDQRVERAQRRLTGGGVVVRPLAFNRLETELAGIHAVSLDAFQDAFLFQPITFQSLHRLSAPVWACVDPSLILLAERAEEIVGFVFAVPNHCQSQRGESVDTAVLKTLAVRRDRTLAGLGGLLIQRLHEAAQRAGMRRVIHALMHEENTRARALSSPLARPVRRYALYAKGLA